MPTEPNGGAHGRSMRRSRATGMLGLALVLGACSGKIGDTPHGADSSGNANGVGGPGGGVGPGALGCDSFDPGPSPLRRLTRWEYNHTVHDLLGDATKPADGDQKP